VKPPHRAALREYYSHFTVVHGSKDFPNLCDCNGDELLPAFVLVALIFVFLKWRLQREREQ